MRVPDFCPAFVFDCGAAAAGLSTRDVTASAAPNLTIVTTPPALPVDGKVGTLKDKSWQGTRRKLTGATPMARLPAVDANKQQRNRLDDVLPPRQTAAGQDRRRRLLQVRRRVDAPSLASDSVSLPPTPTPLVMP